MKNHMYQVIRSDKTFTIHEYLYGVRQTESQVYPVGELSRQLYRIPSHFVRLETIKTNDKGVRDNSDLKNKAD